MAPSVLDALRRPDELAAWLAVLTPQPVLMEPLVALAAARLGRAGKLDALIALRRHVAMLAAQEQELLAGIAADDPSEEQWCREDIAAALRLPPATVATLLAIATELVYRLPATLAALRTGEISERHARVLAEATGPLSTANAATVESRALRAAGEHTVAQFRAEVRRAVLRVDTDAEKRHQDRLAERRVVITPVEDGMAELWALLPAAAAATVKAALDCCAAETTCGPGGDPRSADQRRADALVELCSAALDDPAAAREHGRRPAIHVTVAATTLLGLDEQPAELAGYGPITAAMARRIAQDPSGTWRRLITSASGQLLDYGRRTYRPPQRLADHVITRDRTCRFPGCRRRAARCELDHVQPFDSGGTTSADNLLTLCRRHHRAKHRAGWQVRRDADTGQVTWKDPNGRAHRCRGEQLPAPGADPDPPP